METSKWVWCTDWCKAKGLSPYISENWKAAELAYQQYQDEDYTE